MPAIGKFPQSMHLSPPSGSALRQCFDVWRQWLALALCQCFDAWRQSLALALRQCFDAWRQWLALPLICANSNASTLGGECCANNTMLEVIARSASSDRHTAQQKQIIICLAPVALLTSLIAPPAKYE